MVFWHILYCGPFPERTRDTVDMEKPVFSDIESRVSFFIIAGVS